MADSSCERLPQGSRSSASISTGHCCINIARVSVAAHSHDTPSGKLNEDTGPLIVIVAEVIGGQMAWTDESILLLCSHTVASITVAIEEVDL